jgi:hypothetical protein
LKILAGAGERNKGNHLYKEREREGKTRNPQINKKQKQ